MKQEPEQITYPNLPLAIYRELAAHLRQIEGIIIDLIPQQSQQFDYTQSQVDHLQLHYPLNLSSDAKQQIDTILNYYAQRYGDYERKILTTLS
ncbi:hypothetical protein VB715_18110 [Crocosphaera sp. UHCC 0190]|uniref:hypothetical protein n=1 Tax=Crocosphaera sp. UHCC 0190 TaxID=3110246 RepID=UPI002B20FA72|nr:hypothetical protein [Crocosphaera sp. UHCC 0190]MEA5511692.1 hypothetical protein [Crocosphaera sp. UHCC 0190]